MQAFLLILENVESVGFVVTVYLSTLLFLPPNHPHTLCLALRLSVYVYVQGHGKMEEIDLRL